MTHSQWYECGYSVGTWTEYCDREFLLSVFLDGRTFHNDAWDDTHTDAWRMGFSDARHDRKLDMARSP